MESKNYPLEGCQSNSEGWTSKIRTKLASAILALTGFQGVADLKRVFPFVCSVHSHGCLATATPLVKESEGLRVSPGVPKRRESPLGTHARRGASSPSLSAERGAQPSSRSWLAALPGERGVSARSFAPVARGTETSVGGSHRSALPGAHQRQGEGNQTRAAAGAGEGSPLAPRPAAAARPPPAGRAPGLQGRCGHSQRPERWPEP